jgi:hypothetical protein
MFAYRERRPASPASCRVQLGCHSRPPAKLSSKADLAMNAVVGFATVPPAPQGEMRSKLMPVSTSTPEQKIAPLVCPFHARP